LVPHTGQPGLRRLAQQRVVVIGIDGNRGDRNIRAKATAEFAEQLGGAVNLAFCPFNRVAARTAPEQHAGKQQRNQRRQPPSQQA